MATAILAPATEEDERRFVLHGVPWSAYVALRDALDDQSGLKMTWSKPSAPAPRLAPPAPNSRRGLPKFVAQI